jgi:hypothetical protein
VPRQIRWRHDRRNGNVRAPALPRTAARRAPTARAT